jgi:hypothetical protein
MSKNILWCWSSCVLALACSSDGGHGADGSESSSGTESSTSPSPTGGSPTSVSSVDDTQGTTDEPTASESSSESTGTPGEPDAYGGDWCGNASTGRLAIGALAVPIAFGGSRQAEHAFVGWVNATEEVQVARYDVAAADWSEPTTLDEGYAAFAFDDAPRGGVDEQGNAIVAYVTQDAEPHPRVQHYDAATEVWTVIDLPGTFASPRLGTIVVAPTGHAVLVVYDNVGPVQVTAASTYFYDPATAEWSEPTTGEPVDQLFYEDTMLVSVDRESGDAVLAQGLDSGVIAIQHRDAATGATDLVEIETPAYAHSLASLGAGEHVLVSYIGGFQASSQIYVHHFDGTDWQDEFAVGSGYDVGPIRLTNGPGRAVVSWNDGQWGTYVREFRSEGGWQELLTANPGDPEGFSAWAGHAVALEDDGMFVAWSTFGSTGGIRTFSRHLGGADWDDAVELDPAQPSDYTRISVLTSLGENRARAVWSRDSEGTYYAIAHACHTPVSRWSDPIEVPGSLYLVDARPGGEVLVMGTDEDGKGYAEYFAAE